MLTPIDLGGAFMFADSGTVIPVTEARDKLTDLIATTKQGRFPVIGRYREPGAVLVAPDLVRLLPQLLSTMAGETGRHGAEERLRDPDRRVAMLGDPWPFVAIALWMNGHRAMFAQFASDTLHTIRSKDAANDLPRMTVAEFLEAMPMTLGGDLPDAERRSSHRPAGGVPACDDRVAARSARSLAKRTGVDIPEPEQDAAGVSRERLYKILESDDD